MKKNPPKAQKYYADVDEKPPAVSMTRAFVLSCIVFWLCGVLFGGVAFGLAVLGHNSAAIGDTRIAKHLRTASYWLSIAGIIVGAVVISLVVTYLLTSGVLNDGQ